MSSTTRIRALAATIAVTTGALFFMAGGPAQAADSARSGSADEVCWSEPKSGALQCFTDEATLAEAVFTQTGRILVEEGSSLASRPSAGLLATYVLARLYEDASYGGTAYLVLSPSSTACTTGTGKSENLPPAWQDRVSSFRSYFSCSTRIFEDVGYAGSWFGYSINAPGVGALDNEASSVKAQ